MEVLSWAHVYTWCINSQLKTRFPCMWLHERHERMLFWWGRLCAVEYVNRQRKLIFNWRLMHSRTCTYIASTASRVFWVSRMHMHFQVRWKIYTIVVKQKTKNKKQNPQKIEKQKKIFMIGLFHRFIHHYKSTSRGTSIMFYDNHSLNVKNCTIGFHIWQEFYSYSNTVKLHP